MRVALVVAVLTAGCSTLGSEDLAPVPQSHGGVGPFRPLTAEETGIVGTPAGRALVTRRAVCGGMVAEAHLFWCGAEMVADAPEPVPEVPEGDVDWSLFEPTRILRSPSNGALGFASDGTEVVLAAELPWEGEALRDPWVVTVEDRVRLYYAGAAGLGVAEAASVDGPFERISDQPILTGEPAPRHPSVVRLGGRWLLYFESAEGRIGVAESEDGVEFEVVERQLALGATGSGAPFEAGVASPGAVVVETPIGRRVVRLYLESLREDGSHALGLAASEDGLAFERLGRPVMEEEDRRDPAPLVVDGRVTLLYHTAPRAVGDVAFRAVAAAVAPRTVGL